MSGDSNSHINVNMGFHGFESSFYQEFTLIMSYKSVCTRQLGIKHTHTLAPLRRPRSTREGHSALM